MALDDVLPANALWLLVTNLPALRSIAYGPTLMPQSMALHVVLPGDASWLPVIDPPAEHSTQTCPWRHVDATLGGPTCGIDWR